MSKCGRRPIDVTGVTITVKGQEVHYKGPKSSGVYTLTEPLIARVEDKKLFVVLGDKTNVSPKQMRDVNRIWGLEHALLQNKVSGSIKEFEKRLKIIGLGFKAAVAGKTITFQLGFSHKIEFAIPDDVSIELDKPGQTVVVRSIDPVAAGAFASKIKRLRPPEPYKGTGIKEESEVIRRKAGKTKAG